MPYRFLYAGGENKIKEIPERIPILNNGRFILFALHQDVKSMGFSHYFIHKEQQILIKLYKPLKPKQTFREIILFKADPWLCEKDR